VHWYGLTNYRTLYMPTLGLYAGAQQVQYATFNPVIIRDDMG